MDFIPLATRKPQTIRELQHLMNRHGIDADCNTPDFMLAEFLAGVLDQYQQLHYANSKWHGDFTMVKRRIQEQLFDPDMGEVCEDPTCPYYRLRHPEGTEEHEPTQQA